MNYSLNTTPEVIDKKFIVRFPKELSQSFPSRSMQMIQGRIGDIPFTAPVEPDGEGSHFFVLPNEVMEVVSPDSEINLSFDLLDTWPDPEVPQDFSQRLHDTDLFSFWETLTTKARWEWIRWIRSTKVQATRDKRIGVAISKLSKGSRRPCCFNTASCTIPELAKSGVLLPSEKQPEN